jgi:hypothetical protein
MNTNLYALALTFSVNNSYHFGGMGVTRQMRTRKRQIVTVRKFVRGRSRTLPMEFLLQRDSNTLGK